MTNTFTSLANGAGWLDTEAGNGPESDANRLGRIPTSATESRTGADMEGIHLRSMREVRGFEIEDGDPKQAPSTQSEDCEAS